MTHRRSFWLALVATVGLLAASCTGTGESSGTSGSTGAPLDRDPNTLVVAVDAFNADFDPASAYLLSEALIWRGIYESLIRLKGDSASEVEPLLADRGKRTQTPRAGPSTCTRGSRSATAPRWTPRP